MGDSSEIADSYRALTIEWADATSDPGAANKVFLRHHAYYKSVRNDPAGRAAISELLADENDAVRMMAATHSLGWDPERASRVLQELVDRPSPYDFDAKYTLKAYREGTLDLDW